MLHSLNCPNCGAALPKSAVMGDVAICDYCKTSFRIAQTFTPQPDMGDLMLGADFSSLPLLGWELLNPEQVTFPVRYPPELECYFPASEQVHYVLQTPGMFDDYDVSLTVRHLEGDQEWIRAGLVTRFSAEQGAYLIFVSAQGTYMIGAYEYSKSDEKLKWAGEIVKWTASSALRSEMGEPNRLRVIQRGSQMRVYLNGVLSTSLRDDRFLVGKIRLGVEPSQHTSIRVAFSDLQVRETPER